MSVFRFREIYCIACHRSVAWTMAIGTMPRVYCDRCAFQGKAAECEHDRSPEIVNCEAFQK